MDSLLEVKSKLDIVDMVSTYVALKKSGRNYKGLCPFHPEKSPSFMVSPELQIYKCFGCGAAGDAFNFYKNVEGLEFYEALKALALKVGVVLSSAPIDPQSEKKKVIYHINELATNLFHHILLKTPTGKIGLDYLLQKRGCTLETIKKFKLGYAPDSFHTIYDFFKKQKFLDEDLVLAGLVSQNSRGQIFDKFRGRIMIPFISLDGNIVGFTGRTVINQEPKFLHSSENPVFHKSNFLFGLNFAKSEIKLKGSLIVEGNLDVIMSHQAGLTHAVASSGTALTDGQLKLLSRFSKDVVLGFDADLAGQNAIDHALELLEQNNMNVKVLKLFDGVKDIDEALNTNLKKTLNLFKEDMPSIYEFLFQRVVQKYNLHDPLQKKRASQEVLALIKRFKDEVIINFYKKKTEELFDIDLNTIVQKPAPREKDVEIAEIPVVSLEEHVLTLLLSLELDILPDFVYKLDLEDFTNPITGKIYQILLNSLQDSGKSFSIKSIQDSLEEKEQEFFKRLILSPKALDVLQLNKELIIAIKRLKTFTAKRKLFALQKQIKQAELQNNINLAIELAKQVTQLTEELKNQ